ncbi:MAG: PhzF family phenazine biosynthesis protein [Gemmatimonadetes bacterium]|nr:PhzF family phenazine biosynthesis protein [Gemmatimonadota bacterium]
MSTHETIVQVDAFTRTPFAGNPAGVCVLDGPRADAWMQAVAGEMNLSETAFLVPEGDAFRLRWFTPSTEVDLCGHATLASAHVLYESGRLDTDAEARFHTRSGVLTARLDGDWIEMDFPATRAEPAQPPPGLIDALGVEPVAVARSRFDYLVEVRAAGEVRDLAPDFHRLRAIEARGVIVTAPSDRAGHDIVSRFFAPRAGVDEDPVTGSAHCSLGPWWAAKLGRDTIVAYQASARGGVMQVVVRGDRVLLRGQAVTVLEGRILVGNGAGFTEHKD